MGSMDLFIKKYGEGKHYYTIDLSRLSEYDNSIFIPELKEFLENEGISSYMDGFFWTLNPLDYADWLNDWLYFEDRSIPFARTVFGEILFIREKEIMILNSNKGLVDFTTDKVDSFFNWYLVDDWFLNKYFKKDLYDNLNPKPVLAPDECLDYGSLLSYEGSKHSTNLETVDMKNYLERVSKASEGIRFFNDKPKPVMKVLSINDI